MRRVLLGAALVLGLAASGCGSGATGLVLNLDSNYQVPSEVDGVLVEVSGQSGTPKQKHFDLKDPFPQSVAVVVDDNEREVTVTVSAEKGTTVITKSRVTVDLVQGRMQDFTLNL